MTACEQLAENFHCSPYEFYDKPSHEIWSIYGRAVERMKKQRRND